MSKASIAGILSGLLPAAEGDERLRMAAGLALDTASMQDDEHSYSREDIVRAADFVTRVYGDEAEAHAARYAPPGKELFARLVLREIQSRRGR